VSINFDRFNPFEIAENILNSPGDLEFHLNKLYEEELRGRVIQFEGEGQIPGILLSYVLSGQAPIELLEQLGLVSGNVNDDTPNEPLPEPIEPEEREIPTADPVTSLRFAMLATLFPGIKPETFNESGFTQQQNFPGLAPSFDR